MHVEYQKKKKLNIFVLPWIVNEEVNVHFNKQQPINLIGWL